MFRGDCMNSAPPNMSPLLIPLFSNVVSGGLKAVGGALKKYGEDTDAKFATTVNFDNDQALNGCLHVVHGSVYTNKAEFAKSNQQLEKLLPLPWESIANANVKTNATPKDVKDQITRSVAAAKQVLASSGAMLAEKPRFFAELRLIKSKDNSSVAFRLRSLYYGAPINDGWFTRSSAKALVVSISAFDATKPLMDNLKSGYSVALSDVPIGSAWVTGDLLYPNIANVTTWDSPWFAGPTDGKKPLTIVTGILETSAGSKLLNVIGTAVEGSADNTAKALADSLDSNKRATDAITEKGAIDKARSDAAAATVKAITDLTKAKDAYDACVVALTMPPVGSTTSISKVQQDTLFAFASAKVTAAASISAAEPLFSELKLPTDFINGPGACAFP